MSEPAGEPVNVLLELRHEVVSTGVVPVTRTAVRSAAAGLDGRIDVDDLALLVSELVANAVLHGRPPVVVRLLALDDRAVRVEVDDAAHDVPPSLVTVGEGPGQDHDTARGLAVVAAVADEWGWRPAADGKTVWCELPIRHP